MAKVVQVIVTRDRRGRGIEDDPVRMACQLWTLDGELIVEHDMLNAASLKSGPGLVKMDAEAGR